MYIIITEKNKLPQGELMAESERWSSDPMNLLVNASVGM